MNFECIREDMRPIDMNGVSATLSPTSIITGKPSPDLNAMQIEFGAYAQVFEDNNPTNTVRVRSLGAIALTPTGNARGDYYFLSLTTGARIARYQWTKLPITDTAIARVKALALHEGQPLIQDSGLVVEWRPGQAIADEEYDVNFAGVDNDIDDPFREVDFDPILFDEIAALGINRPGHVDGPNNTLIIVAHEASLAEEDHHNENQGAQGCDDH